ncbi:MAG TPA: AEC family transporter [Terrimicrobiaceae bacterium]
MIAQFFFLLQIVLPVFAVMAVGYLTRRLNVLSSEADRSLTRLVVTLLLPCLALNTIIGNESLKEPENCLLPPLLGFGCIALGIVVSRLAAKVFRITQDDSVRTFVFTTSIQNAGYIPIPLCSSLFGDDATGVLFAFILGVDLAFWSIAIWQLVGRRGGNAWRQLLSPPTIAITAGLVLNGLGANAWMPAAIGTTIAALAGCAIPLALLLSGALIADHVNLDSLRHGSRTILASAVVRIGILPLLILLFTKIAPLDTAIKSVLVIEAAMPAAILPIVVTKVHQGDMDTALQVVLGTSLIGLVTIPLWISFGLHWIIPGW